MKTEIIDSVEFQLNDELALLIHEQSQDSRVCCAYVTEEE